ncbi:nitroreductase family deazaflavin-dependent oxidoreductase [Phytohabitans sp. ZYX-F-186]|uniref:Nitroreductase family deazaflavin-dependent oxidoreductase n=1 Tax=Phytohabitans maris TaxID=3071409 RepID=A0ABU0ZD14_9ACTN|nr:nitroreductase family deazaflavin-dependent oxidoreductase [Phytohabitans sp. ZYX-F-186]MDQ7904951.1 nitroreductase family deazaflavin-dependent oxidoreductase [Phytohabitans sp. ZYX-F-186]
MVLPRRLARANRVVGNRVLGPVARHLPGFGIVVHRGRRSGRAYRTPVNIFKTTDGYVVALTYGLGDWTRNVLAAGGCTVEIRRRPVHLTDPRLVDDPTRSAVPLPIRPILAALGVTEFLHLRPIPPSPGL